MSERIPSDPNPFENVDIKLFDWDGFRYRAKRLASFLFDRVMWEGSSDHFKPPEVLVGELKEVPKPINDMPVIFGFGSEGNYL